MAKQFKFDEVQQDLFQPAEKKHIYTVSELTRQIKGTLENKFPEVWVEGEISNFKLHTSGHIYFTLKDEQSQLKAVMWRDSVQGLKFELKDGLQVLLFGRISVFDRQGQYQIYIENVEPKGLGALQLAFQQLKEKLAKEGLFDPAHKKPIPVLPTCVGIVTSPTGAAVRDMLNILRRRFSNIEVVINPARVQGAGAGEEIAQAIKDFNAWGKVDVMIVGRGGGSLEDLWAFNEEVVARAVYGSKIPVISAVGHETDWTIADFVADLRAPTPSAAAELVVGRKEEMSADIQTLAGRLRSALLNKVREEWQGLDGLKESLHLHFRHTIEIHRERLNTLLGKLKVLSPQAILLRSRQKLTELIGRLVTGAQHSLSVIRESYSGLIGKLDTLSPLAVLSRGYSITFKLPERQILKNAMGLKRGDVIETELKEGRITSRVEGTDGGTNV